MPEWLQEDYERAGQKLAELALTRLRDGADSDTLQSTLAVLAIARGGLKLGAMISHLDSSELDEILEQNLSCKSFMAKGPAAKPCS